LNDIIKNYKTLTKGSGKTIRNQKDQIGIIIIIIEKKNHKLDLNDKIGSHKN
jgi:hypothetical protein